MASKVLPKSEQNFIRFVKVCLDVLKLPLVDILASEIQPADLYNEIQQHSCSLLNGQNKLDSNQLKICVIPPPAKPDYKQFDVTLLYKLIRNLCPSLEPTKGWGKDPVDADTQIGDDIERLRLFRNNKFHGSSSTISDNDFEKMWNNLKSVIQRVQSYIASKGVKANYEDKLINIKQVDLGNETIDVYKMSYLLERALDRIEQSDERDLPIIDVWDVTTGKDGINIHYEVKHKSQIEIKWIKDGEVIDSRSKKYKGGDLDDSIFTITSPTLEDRGDYSCIVKHAVGNVKKNVHLDIPKAKISTEQQVYFGSATTLTSNIFSCPSPDGVEWQKSNDGKTYDPINIRQLKYNGSDSKHESPLLVIPKVTFEDKLHYRLLVWNKIGEQYSNTVFLNVIGSSPNITISHQTCVSDKSVKLIGNVFLYGNLPAVQTVFWTKNGRNLETEGNGDKFSNVSVDNPSLTIFKVNEYDAGHYQLTATNAIGSTKSDFIILGVPDVSFGRPEKKNDGRIWFKVAIQAIPAPDNVRWSMKDKTSNAFVSIDENLEEFKGTSSTLPQPVLVFKPKNDLHTYCFQIEVHNFIGSCIKIFPDETSSNDSFTNGNQVGFLSEFYLDGGAAVKFAKLFDDIAEHFPENKIRRLKHFIRYSYLKDNKDKTLFAKTVSARDCLEILSDKNLFTPWDLIFVQHLLKNTECMDLFEKCVAYAEEHGALCFYEKLPENGYKKVQFHVRGTLSCYTKAEIEKIRDTVAAIVGCNSTEIHVTGYYPSASFLVVLSIEDKLARKLLTVEQQEKDKLCKLNIDYFIVDFITVHLQNHIEPGPKPYFDLNVTRASSLEEQRIPCTVGNEKPSFWHIQALQYLTRINFAYPDRRNAEKKHSDIESVYNEKYNAILVASISVDTREVKHISCLMPDKIWISDMKTINEIDEKGCTLKQLDIYYTLCGSHTLTDAGDLLFLKDNDVYILTLSGDISSLCIRAPLHFCIHSSRINGHILIGDVNIVTRYTDSGERLKQIILDDNGEQIYDEIIFITENKNGDIIVSDTGRKAVVGVDKTGRLLFNYTGLSQSTFHPRGICVDTLGNILACDVSSNQNIHLLDQDGKFLTYLLTKDQQSFGFPQAICIDDKHNLYVGYSGINRLDVFTYLTDDLLKERDIKITEKEEKMLSKEKAMELPKYKKEYPVYPPLQPLRVRSAISTPQSYKRHVDIFNDITLRKPHNLSKGKPEENVSLTPVQQSRFVVKTEKASTDLSKYMIGRTASNPFLQLPPVLKSRQPLFKRALKYTSVDSIGAGNTFKVIRFHMKHSHFENNAFLLRTIEYKIRKMVECSSEEIWIDEVVKGFIKLSLMEIYIDKLLTIKQTGKDTLTGLGIDYFTVDYITVYLESSKVFRLKDETEFHRTEDKDLELKEKQSKTSSKQQRRTSISKILKPFHAFKRMLLKENTSENSKKLAPGKASHQTYLNSEVYIKSIKVSTYGISHLSCLASDKIWVSDLDKIEEINETEQVVMKLDVESGVFGRHTVTREGHLLFLLNDTVYTLTLTGNIHSLLMKFDIFCIHSSRINNNILVGASDGVTRYSMSDVILQKIYADREGKPLYKRPIYITENNNGDIIVSDEHKKAVVVVDTHGRHRFSYNGCSSAVEFHPRSVCTDLYDHILVCNYSYSHPSVHILDQNGQFLSFLTTKHRSQQGVPQALCVDENHSIYVGYGNKGVIDVYRYLT